MTGSYLFNEETDDKCIHIVCWYTHPYCIQYSQNLITKSYRKYYTIEGEHKNDVLAVQRMSTPKLSNLTLQIHVHMFKGA